MKKLFFALSIVFGLYSCYSDDNDNVDEASVVVYFSNIHPTTLERLTGYYHAPENLVILYFLADNKKGTPTYAVDGTCPVYPSSKNTIEYKYTLTESNKVENIHILCSSCKAEFDVNSGKGLNDPAKGYNIKTYRAKSVFNDTDSDPVKVYIWK